LKLQFLCAAKTVTGSCFYLECNERKLLVECGLYQGQDADEINRAPFAFDPAAIDYIFVTHAHLDHSGLLPKVVKEGFRGKVITTPATRDLLELMLYDAANIQESDAAWDTKKAIRAGRPPVLPLYTVEDVGDVLSLFDVKPYEELCNLGNGIKYRFLDAGHILGSGTLEVWFQDSEREKKIVFSGDIGKKGNPIIRDPSTLVEADFIVMESTYGNRLQKPFKESVDELVEAIRTTFKKGGNAYIRRLRRQDTGPSLYSEQPCQRKKCPICMYIWIARWQKRRQKYIFPIRRYLTKSETAVSTKGFRRLCSNCICAGVSGIDGAEQDTFRASL
jgi:metallo-beta-lactamase family protein